uniref:Uncharacterized protein n=2 Tax=Kuenenia stuttgartiensis TaxID=174633 RepID=Q1PZV5_KUEST|nr:unknown protein [Candidatus Kuenenia stuttgartiensis]
MCLVTLSTETVRMDFSRILQIAGIIVALHALYFGIVKDSMKMEMIMLFIGVVMFYFGRLSGSKR